MPTHRRAEMLGRALDSLAAQSFARDQFEVIVVATAGDVAYEVVADFAKSNSIAVRCVSIPDDPTNGRSPSAKRNFGVAQARAPWVAFIDDDCFADPDWLASAAALFGHPNAGGVEGRKAIPKPPRDTVVYRGLLLFTRPRGFQTCNVFYRKDVFEKIGGFDPNFPYYLEDSDLAWAVLDAGYEIPYAEGAVVYHPVPPPHPWKMLDDAKRAELMPYLFKKHPARYREAGTKVLRWSHWVYIALYAAIVVCAATKLWIGAAIAGVGVLAFLAIHSFKLFRGCATTANEFLVTNLLLPACPVVKWVQLIRGNLKHRVWLWT
jgi:cellulose synthase/poly-beta-1,6-N-acetylglucosamine synthase-like glycosyltransferase